MKKQFENLNDLFAYAGAYFYQFGRYQMQYTLCFDEKKPYLFNKNTMEKIKGLKNINFFLKSHEIEISLD